MGSFPFSSAGLKLNYYWVRIGEDRTLEKDEL